MDQETSHQKERASLIRSMLHFASGTFLSKCFGILREVVMAAFFGAHPLLASWLVAYRSSHLLRRIVGEGGLSNGFIPHFERLRLESEPRAAAFFRDVFFSLFLTLFLFIGSVEIFISTCGEKIFSHEWLEVSFLVRLMLPSLIFASLYALGMAFMQCQKRYFLSSAAPLLFNLIWIAGLFLSKGMGMEKVVVVLSLATSIGLVAQWAVTFPATYRYWRGELGSSWWRGVRFFSPEIRAMLFSIGLTLLGVGAVQINSVIDLIFAKLCDPKGPAYLTYAARWMQFPLAICAIAVSSAIFPSLAKASALFEKEKIGSYLTHAFRHMLHLLLLSTLFLLIVGGSLMTLFFGYGHFTLEAIWKTKESLAGYAVGLIPSGFVTLFAVVFYAQKRFIVPVVGALISIVASLFFNLLFIYGFSLGPESIAYATSIGAFVNALFLFWKLGPIEWEKKELKRSIRQALSTALLFLSLYGAGHFLFDGVAKSLFLEEPSAYFVRGAWLFHGARIAFFLGLYALVSFVLSVREWKEILRRA